MNALTGQPLPPDVSGGPEWLESLRVSARGGYSGLPDRRVEEWKYTTVPGWSGTEAESRRPQVADALVEAATIDMRDGDLLAINGTLPAGVQVRSLAAVLGEGSPWLREVLESLDIGGRRHAFSQLNTAGLEAGLAIEVDEGVDAGRLLIRWTGQPGLLAHARVCVVMAPGSALQLVEQIEAIAGETALLNLVAQARLGSGSKLVLTRMQDLPEQSLLVTRTEVMQQHDSVFRYHGVDLGRGTTRHDVRAELAGAAATCDLQAAVLGRDQGHTDYHIEADHQAPACTSNQVFRAVARDKARIVFNGRVHVAAGADGTDASQSSAGLLLSATAEIDAKPELEIYADEVVAGHGATVGQLDEQALFYLRSRGLSAQQARNILVRAFCRSVIDRVRGADLREALATRLDRGMDAP